MVPEWMSPGCWAVGETHIPASWSHGPRDEATTMQSIGGPGWGGQGIPSGADVEAQS